MIASNAKALNLQTIEALPRARRKSNKYVPAILVTASGARDEILLNKRVGTLDAPDRFTLHLNGMMSVVEIVIIHRHEATGEPTLVEISTC